MINLAVWNLLFMVRFVMSALFAVGFLPFFSIGDCRESSTIASHSPCAMLTLTWDMRMSLRRQLAVWSERRQCEDCSSSYGQCYECNSDLLFHSKLPCYVSGATSIIVNLWFVYYLEACCISIYHSSSIFSAKTI